MLDVPQPGRSHLVRLGLVLLAALALLAGGVSAAAAADTPPGGSWVRAAHLLPGGPTAQVTLAPADGATGPAIVLTQGVGYGSATDYRSVPPGAYAVTVRAVGSAADAAPLLSTTYTARPGSAVTLAMLGSVAQARLAVLQDDLTPPAAGSARVRVLPAAGSAPQVTVQAQGGPTLASDAVLGQPTAYVTVPAGPWPVTVSAGSTPAGTGTVQLASGAVYTVLVLDGAAPGQVRIDLLTDAAGVTVAPVGGAATGGGGTATVLVGTSLPARVAGMGALAGLVLLVALVGLHRRSGSAA